MVEWCGLAVAVLYRGAPQRDSEEVGADSWMIAKALKGPGQRRVEPEFGSHAGFGAGAGSDLTGSVSVSCDRVRPSRARCPHVLIVGLLCRRRPTSDGSVVRIEYGAKSIHLQERRSEESLTQPNLAQI